MSAPATCDAPIGWEALVAYWADDADAAETDRVDEHLLGKAARERAEVHRLDLGHVGEDVELLVGGGGRAGVGVTHPPRYVATRTEHETIDAGRILDAPRAHRLEHGDHDGLGEVAGALLVAEMLPPVEQRTRAEAPAQQNLGLVRARVARAVRVVTRDAAHELGVLPDVVHPTAERSTRCSR
jgi:hypothetical protein